ncbi:predicted protein [Uncinocarpus reesii 1704]|uniref:Altered inheritance of mitochondria protein 9, mitochondrial n=1 Tax=Uncinocarpus reesii (strain UAMH 1704) TaxID=336963 RepID=C4JEP7_UNCRE|nr:uncharacterized protein UREG_02207 [Uncinocarpus reesii 1704]EEP77358.1 predicted protein [Uncinocarpus reesii 1704]
MDTGRTVVARIPTSVAGPSRLTTNSEVATISYLKSKLSLPIPKILAWSDDPNNPAGIEYIIQEHVDGAQLHGQWPQMTSSEHMHCTKDLSFKLRDMATLEFPAYGNIYFADAPIDATSKIPLEDGFCIGPYCNPLFWNCGAGDMEMYDERIQKAGLPTLIHADYNKRNIYVSPKDTTQITGLIDWQLTCIEPAFIYAHSTPDFAALPDINPAEENDQPNSADEQWLLKDLAICHQTYDVIMTYKTPKLRPARELDSSLFRLFHYCFTTWRDGIPAIRQELMDLKGIWADLQLPGDFPYSPDEKEIAEHAQQYEDFETKQKLKAWLKIQMQTTSDGWVPNEVWEAAKEANKAAYDEWIESACSEGMTVEEADKLWPFDSR